MVTNVRVRERKKFVWITFIAASILLFLLTCIFYYFYITEGDLITQKIEDVDPRDLKERDYVVRDLGITRVFYSATTNGGIVVSYLIIYFRLKYYAI